MQVTIKTDSQIEKMRIANKIIAELHNYIEKFVKPGISTYELNEIAIDFLKSKNVKSNFLNYNGFPGVICASVDEEIIHGIPSKKKILKEGQIISIDTGCIFEGYHADAARTFAVGKISSEKQRLIEVTKQSFFEAIKIIKPGVRLGDVGYAIQKYVEDNGFSVVKEFCGHGIGKNLHEDPQVLNYGHPGKGFRLRENMTIAIEPMVNMGTEECKTLDDDFTVVTKDNLPSAHYENTILITKDGCEILSL